MAAVSWCLLSFPSHVLPRSPAKVTAGSQFGVSITQRDLNYHDKVKKCHRAGSWLTSCPASRCPPSRLNKCIDNCSLVKVLCRSHYYALCRSNSKTFVLVFMDEKIRLGRAATRQQLQPQFGKEDAVRRLLQFPSRSTEWLGKFCKATWDETSADVVSTFPTRKKCMPILDCSLSSPTRFNSYQSGKLKFWIIAVSTSDELLAAATLRAQLFYSYPKFPPSGCEGLEGIKARLKHDFEVQYLFKARVKSEFERDTKMQDLNMNVKCLLAVCQESDYDELLVASNGKRNSLVSPPTLDSSGFSRNPLVAIGTLDIQDGTGSIPTVDVDNVTFQLYNVANSRKRKFSKRRQVGMRQLERTIACDKREMTLLTLLLFGSKFIHNCVRSTSEIRELGVVVQVSEDGPGHRLLSFTSQQKLDVSHGYIFNLCVSHTARRLGVATALMKEAVPLAQQIRLRILYVHVEANNISALALYQKLGYIVEEEEALDVEQRFQRPRRILLSYHCP